MKHPFKGFSCTRPTVLTISEEKSTYEVYFLIYLPIGKPVPYRFSRGINSLKVNQRKGMAQDLADAFWDALKDGWNPLKMKYPQFEDEKSKLQALTFGTGLAHALKLKKEILSIWSYPDYKGTVRFIHKAAIECGLNDTPIENIDRKDIRLIISVAKEQNDWTSNARNKYLTLLKALLTVLVDDEKLKTNPAHGIKSEKVVKGPGFKRLTDPEHEKIVEHLYTNHPDFFEYVMTIEDVLIRRKELLMIQVCDINLAARQLTIRESVAKTNTERKIPITDDFLNVLLRRRVYLLPKDWYLFSSDKFRPGPGKYHPNVPTTWWREIVIEGLGIDCKMYSLKHRGADKKILAGISIEALKDICGHKSIQMTEVYAQEIKNVHANEIISKSPSYMAKIVQMKKAK